MLTSSLANHFLIAMPSLHDPYFHKSVIYICEHDPQGSVGLMINRPLQYQLGFVFEQLQIDKIDEKSSRLPVLFGGPLQTERGFVLHRPHGLWRSSLYLQDNVTVTTSNDIIRAIAATAGPDDVLVTLGYSGWVGNQLEQEVLDNRWLVCPFKTELLYDVPFDKRWEFAGMSLGVNMHQLVSDAGHA